MKAITNEQTQKFRAAFLRNDKQRALQRATVKNGILEAASNPLNQIEHLPVFSIDIATGKVANQKQSGRCWMFAALNTFRHKMLHQFKLKDFELSQNYTFFWDKYEKANYFYENILKTADQALDSRKVAFLLTTPQQDGGQWDMIVALFQKYGVVPKAAMPESSNSSNSRELNRLLNKKLRKDAYTLRHLVENHASEEQIQQEKQEMLAEIYRFLAISLGTPPETFDFEYRDEDNQYHLAQNLTPQTFYQTYIDIPLDEYVSLINAPTKDKPYNQTYTVEMLGNVAEAKPVKYLNVSMETFKKVTIAQLEQGESVWFGCDVGQSSMREQGILALDAFDIDALFDIDFSTSKAQRLDYGESLMTHAMVLTGVDLIEDKPVKWKVENSWGEKVGKQGFFVMSDAWMDAFTYQVVVHQSYLPKELQEAWQKEPQVLAPWDPMGALA